MRHHASLITAALFLAGSAIAGPLEDGRAALKNGDHETALRLFQSLAEQGDAEAQLHLGVMFVKGQGMSPDLNAAQTWFKQAAENPAAPKETRDDAIYNRDSISRKLKEWAEADAIEAAQRQANAAAAAQQLQTARATEAAARARKELEDIRWENERRKARMMERVEEDSARRRRALDDELARIRTDQAQRDANSYELRSRSESRGSWNFGHSR